MKIKLIKIEDFKVGFERLKNSPLELADTKIYEYADARFEIKRLSLDQVLPTTFYALKRNLKFQNELKDKLNQELGIDLFNLPGVIYLMLDGKTIGLVPPFVEIYPEEVKGTKQVVTALQDGAHRFLLANQLGVSQKCIAITNQGASPDYLPYAFTNTWDEVQLVDKVPLVKKRYRRTPHYSYMRPLRAIFDQNLVSDWADYNR